MGRAPENLDARGQDLGRDDGHAGVSISVCVRCMLMYGIQGNTPSFVRRPRHPPPSQVVAETMEAIIEQLTTEQRENATSSDDAHKVFGLCVCGVRFQECVRAYERHVHCTYVSDMSERAGARNIASYRAPAQAWMENKLNCVAPEAE
eukprot:16010053-Heterocapsa_arctica.AAC.2